MFDHIFFYKSKGGVSIHSNNKSTPLKPSLEPGELSRDQKYFNKKWIYIILETLFATAKIGEDLCFELILSAVPRSNKKVNIQTNKQNK